VRLLTLLPPSHLVQSMGTDAFTIVEVPRFYARRLMAYQPQYLRDYYASNAWELRRNRYAKRHWKKCAACGRVQGSIHLHISSTGAHGAIFGIEPTRAKNRTSR
jgi:hypothetical protein